MSLIVITLLLLVRATYIYMGVFLRAHSVRGEPRISAQRQRSGCNIVMCCIIFPVFYRP